MYWSWTCGMNDMERGACLRDASARGFAWRFPRQVNNDRARAHIFSPATAAFTDRNTQ